MFIRTTLSLLLAAVLAAVSTPGSAGPADTKAAPKAPAMKAPATKAPVAAAPVADPEPTTDASPEQLRAAERVFYGAYHCENNQTVLVSTMPKYPGYVVLKHNTREYNMRASESATGAILLEGITGETKVVQIANKSMLLNVKTGQRILDGCVSEEQRKKMETEKVSAAGAAPAAN